MVNYGRPKSQSGQFFICLAPCPQLDGRNVAFGRVVEGLEVVQQLEQLAQEVPHLWGNCDLWACNLLAKSCPALNIWSACGAVIGG